MKKIITISLAGMAALAAATGVANAAEVTVPWGDWVASLLTVGNDNLLIIVMAFLAFIVRQLPSAVVDIINTWKVDQLLGKAIVAAVNKTAGAAQGEALKVDIANDVVAKAVQYALDNGPAWLIKWIGGVDGVKDKIIARINVEKGGAVS